MTDEEQQMVIATVEATGVDDLERAMIEAVLQTIFIVRDAQGYSVADTIDHIRTELLPVLEGRR